MAMIAVTSLSPMEAVSEDELPAGPGWQYEPKWDGFRCLAFRDGDKVDLRAKSGKPLARYFPEIVAALRQARQTRFIIDGELVIVLHEHLSFEALQMRLHPAASRITKLSHETPATLIAFDMVVSPEGRDLRSEPLTRRRAALESFAKAARVPRLSLSAFTHKRAEALKWLAKAGGDVDGVVAKRADGPYLAGERAMVKVKRRRSADCVVGGFRYARNSKLVGSLLLGLYNDQGLLDHVGFTATIATADKPALTKRLEKLIQPPGFSGDRPDKPSRWSNERTSEWQPLRPQLVVEVLYDHVSGARFRHGTRLLRWRPDKAPRQCTFEQIKPARRAPLSRRLIGAPLSAPAQTGKGRRRTTGEIDA